MSARDFSWMSGLTLSIVFSIKIEDGSVLAADSAYPLLGRNHQTGQTSEFKLVRNSVLVGFGLRFSRTSLRPTASRTFKSQINATSLI